MTTPKVEIAHGRTPTVGRKVLIVKYPRELAGFLALDPALEAEGYIHAINPKAGMITVDLAAEGKGSGPFEDFPSKRVYYPQDW